MSFTAETVLGGERQRNLPLWGAALLVILAAHVAVGLFVLFRHGEEPAGNNAPDAIMIDLAPLPAPPAAEESPAPPVEQPKAEAAPKAEEAPKAEAPPTPEEPPKAEEPPQATEAPPAPQPEPDTAAMAVPDAAPVPQPIAPPPPVQVPELPKVPNAEVTLAAPTKLDATPEKDATQEAAKKEAEKKEAAKREAERREAAKKEAAKKEAAKKEAAKKEALKREARLEAAQRPAASAAAASPNLASWKSELAARIRRFQHYPDAARARGEAGTATVSFTINGSGQVVAAHLSGSSGSGVLDQEAVATVRRASPMPAPPTGGSVTINVPLRYSLR